MAMGNVWREPPSAIDRPPQGAVGALMVPLVGLGLADFDTLPDPVVCIDASGIIAGWNRAAEMLFGYTAREVFGTRLAIVPPEEEWANAFRARVMGGETVGPIEVERFNKGGERLTLLLSAAPWRIGGEVVGLLTTFKDLSQQKAREHELTRQVAREQRRARDAAYLAAVADACVTSVDAATLFQTLTECTADWTDSAGIVRRMEGRGELVADAARTLDEDGAVAALFKALAATASLDKDAVATLECAAARVGAAVVQRDAHHALQARADALEAEARRKDDFLATVSHELRTPLTAILGFAHIIVENDGLGAERRRGMAEDIVASGGLLLTQVNDLLDIVQLGTGRLTVPMEAVDLSAVVRWCERAVRALMSSKGLRFDRAIPTDLPPVHANTARLQQVLLNFLVNAYKFTPTGGTVTLGARAERGTVSIFVRDTGIGIAPEHAARIFEPFERIESEYTPAQSGAGVGLAVARQLVDLMGGEIGLESTVDIGSAFTVTLKAAGE